MEKAIKIDLQDMSAYSSSSNKPPITILNEYAAQNRLIPHYNLIHDGSSLGVVRFKYSVNLDKFVAEGEGSSKKVAKHLAASNLLKKIINDKSQLLNTNFNGCAISPYDNNIKPNAVFTKMNKANEVDEQDTSVYSSSSNKNSVTMLNEYAAKYHLVPRYNLIHDVSSLSIVSFKYTVNLDKFVAEGEGFSKKVAKQLAATNLIKKIIDDEPQLLNTDFNGCAISPYDNNIKPNAVFTKMNKANEVDQQDMSVYSSPSNKNPVAILNEFANKNHLVPHYNLIHDGSSLGVVSFKYRVNLDKFVAEGEASSKKEAKQLAASNLIKKIIDDEPQLLNTDFNGCAISPYDNNIKPNAVFTKMNKANEVDQQDTSVYSSPSNKNSVAILNEYATKNRLVPHYNLIHDGFSLSRVSFKYRVNLDKFVAEGEASSKKEAKQLAASNLIKKIIDDKPQLLNTDFKVYKISLYDNNNKVNYPRQLNDLCINNNIKLPEYNLVKEERQGHNNLLTIRCQAAKMIETATHSSKKQAKYLAAFQTVNSLMSSDKVVEKCQNVSDSIQALENLNTLKSWPKKISLTKQTTSEDHHLVSKKIEWKNSDTLNMLVNQYKKNGELDLPEPHNILKKIISEHTNLHISSKIEKVKLDFNNYNYWCTFVLTDVEPHIYGLGMDKNLEMAQRIAVKELLTAMCILLK